MIENYEFGLITISGKSYSHDILLYKEEVIKWLRKESHNVSIEDVEDAVSMDPNMILIGTGESGVMIVPEKTREYIKSKGINLMIMRTKSACIAFEELVSAAKKKEGVLLLAHLTC